MDFEVFATRAREIAADFPPEFLEGIERVEVHRQKRAHPYLEGVWTLGECETSPLSDPTGSEPFRSVVHVYHGSFVEMARVDADFDVEDELRETIEHEIRHHLEDRAGERALRDEDDLFEAHARFRAGMEVPPGWYRQGEPLGPGLWAVDLDLFLELEIPRRRWEAALGRTLTLTIEGEPFPIEVPEDARPDEVWTFEGEGLQEEADEEEGQGEEAGDEGDGEEAGASEGPGGDEDDARSLAGDLHVVPVVL